MTPAAKRSPPSYQNCRAVSKTSNESDLTQKLQICQPPGEKKNRQKFNKKFSKILFLLLVLKAQLQAMKLNFLNFHLVNQMPSYQKGRILIMLKNTCI